MLRADAAKRIDISRVGDLGLRGGDRAEEMKEMPGQTD
jgi:hypothetical protein